MMMHTSCIIKFCEIGGTLEKQGQMQKIKFVSAGKEEIFYVNREHLDLKRPIVSTGLTRIKRPFQGEQEEEDDKLNG